MESKDELNQRNTFTWKKEMKRRQKHHRYKFHVDPKMHPFCLSCEGENMFTFVTAQLTQLNRRQCNSLHKLHQCTKCCIFQHKYFRRTFQHRRTNMAQLPQLVILIHNRVVATKQSPYVLVQTSNFFKAEYLRRINPLQSLH